MCKRSMMPIDITFFLVPHMFQPCSFGRFCCVFFFVRERNDVGFTIQREKFFIIQKATMTRKWHALNITALRNMRAGDSAFFSALF